MKTIFCRLCVMLVMTLFCVLPANAGSVKIFKVLPHYLDKEGRHALSPSLFERDRYQALLKANPEKCSTVRFDVLWRNTLSDIDDLNIVIEVRGSKQGENTFAVTEKLTPKKSIWSKWKKVNIPEETFLKIEGINAWRVIIRDGETNLQEYCSFLWDMKPKAESEH
jgi:hypothetical protein